MKRLFVSGVMVLASACSSFDYHAECHAYCDDCMDGVDCEAFCESAETAYLDSRANAEAAGCEAEFDTYIECTLTGLQESCTADLTAECGAEATALSLCEVD